MIGKIVPIAAVFIAIVLLPALAAPSFPTESEYVWCFARTAMPGKLSADISASGLAQADKNAAALLAPAGYRSPAIDDPAYVKYLDAILLLEGAHSSWKAGVAKASLSGDRWALVSSLNSAVASVEGYGESVAASRRLDGAILSSLDAAGLPRLSGELGESEGLTASVLRAQLSDSAALDSRAADALGRVDGFLSSAGSYFAQLRDFARDSNSSYLFSKNCTRLANWSLFECSAESWLVVNIVCASDFGTCVDATDCQATISHNLSRLKTSPPNFASFWSSAREVSPLPASFSRYKAYSGFLYNARVLEARLAGEKAALSAGLDALALDALSEELGVVDPDIVLDFLSSSPPSAAKATGRAGFLNFSASIADAQVASAAPWRDAESSYYSRILGLKSDISALKEAQDEIRSTLSLADAIEAGMDSRLAPQKILEYSRLTRGRRIAAKAADLSLSAEGDEIFLVATSPPSRSFPESVLGGIARRGEGVSVPQGAGRFEIFSALEDRYSASVNLKRQEILARLSDLSDSDRAKFAGYDFLAGPDGWVSPRTAWGFMSLLDSEYSGMLSRARQGDPFVFAQAVLAAPVAAGKPAFYRVFGTIANGGPSEIVSSQRIAFQAPGLPAAGEGRFSVVWSEGGGALDSLASLGGGSAEARARIGPFSSVRFEAEGEFPSPVSSSVASDFERVTSEEYSRQISSNIACSPGFSGDIAVPFANRLPLDSLVVQASSPGGRREFRVSPDGAITVSDTCQAGPHSLDVSLSYPRPVLLSYEETPAGYLVLATNRLSFPLGGLTLEIQLPENASRVYIDGARLFPRADWTISVPRSLGPGETERLEVSFERGAREASPLPECAFCCAISARSLAWPEAKETEAMRYLPELVSAASLLAEDELAPVSALACADDFYGALSLSRKIATDRLKRDGAACANASSSAVSARRLLAVLSDESGKLAALKSRFPSSPFRLPPNVSPAKLDVLEAERTCNATLMGRAEEALASVRDETRSSLSAAARWAYDFFGASYSANLSLPANVGASVEAKVGDGFRKRAESLAQAGAGLPEPSDETSERIVDAILANKADFSAKALSSLESEAGAAVAESSRLSSGHPEAQYYSSLGKESLSQRRLLDGYYAAQYSLILSAGKAASASSSRSMALKALAVAISLVMVGAVVFYKERKNRGRPPKEDNFFGEVR